MKQTVDGDEKQSEYALEKHLKKDQEYWENKYNDFYNNPKRIKGEKDHFAKILSKYMDDNKISIKDFVFHILDIKKDLSDLQAYQNAVSKVSNWRTGRTLPSNVEMVKIKYAIEFGFDKNVSLFNLLYGKKYEDYWHEYLRDLYKNFILYDKLATDLRRENPDSKKFQFNGFSLTGKQIRETCALWGKYFSNSFDYAVSFVDYEKKNSGSRSVWFPIVYFQSHIIKYLGSEETAATAEPVSESEKVYQNIYDDLFKTTTFFDEKFDIGMYDLDTPIEEIIHVNAIHDLDEMSGFRSIDPEGTLSNLYLQTADLTRDTSEFSHGQRKEIFSDIENVSNHFLKELEAINQKRLDMHVE
ncbi:MAG: hypothetical protein ABF899_08420 [Oenococcus sp.]|uniref:hypothetical protein n=1 Tax=Oenococcus sp. TaxID=1979414 RepID=UPI0039ECF14D